MNINEVKELIKLMNENNLSVLELKEEGKSVRLVKNSFTDNENKATAPQRECEVKHVVKEKEEKPDNSCYITSPMVGVFYSAPAPGAEPFVKVGSKVKKGDVICIVEAMKLLNEILAEQDGEITEVCVDNETVVEFGQKLFQMR